MLYKNRHYYYTITGIWRDYLVHILVEILGNYFPFSNATFNSGGFLVKGMFLVKRIFSSIFYFLKYNFSQIFSTVLSTRNRDSFSKFPITHRRKCFTNIRALHTFYHTFPYTALIQNLASFFHKFTINTTRKSGKIRVTEMVDGI